MERIIALIIFILFSPFILAILMLVRLTSSGPAIYRQTRIGKDMELFLIYKIRTMRIGAEKDKSKFDHLNEADGPVFKIRNDPRFTLVGKILSRTGLDEILQLINVIKGDMSFVGPRPLPVEEAKKIPKKYQDRFLVKPGITSLWIVRGAHELSFDEWMRSDLEYVRKKSPLVDLYIMGVTLILMLRWTIREFQQFAKKSFLSFSQ